MSQHQSRVEQSHFAIATDLLSDEGHALAWSNLGYWMHTRNYDSACQQLAELVAEAAQLKAGQRLLELACGHGASLALWQNTYGIQHCTAMDIQADVVSQLQQQLHADQHFAHYNVVQGSFDQAELPVGIQPQHYDTIICVDAAYHAKSTRAFLQFVQQTVQPGGRIAFCTLHKSANWATASRWQKGFHQGLFKMANIPMLSLLTENSIQSMLREYGFEDIQIKHLDDGVLLGFQQFVNRRVKELSTVQKISSGWLKIALTARLCQNLYQHQLLHYSLISARKK
jgi:cyclopropane fatty-acyl-phospholipid synthase-like methyltransferase